MNPMSRLNSRPPPSTPVVVAVVETVAVVAVVVGAVNRDTQMPIAIPIKSQDVNPKHLAPALTNSVSSLSRRVNAHARKNAHIRMTPPNSFIYLNNINLSHNQLQVLNLYLLNLYLIPKPTATLSNSNSKHSRTPSARYLPRLLIPPHQGAPHLLASTNLPATWRVTRVIVPSRAWCARER